MKTLSAAIFKICTALGIHNEEVILTCFDKYVNCSLTINVIESKEPEKEAIKKLEKCLTVRTSKGDAKFLNILTDVKHFVRNESMFIEVEIE